MAVYWSQVARYIEEAHASSGRVERADIVDKAFDDGASDDVIDALDAMGSRVFNTPDDARQFLLSQRIIEEG